jgi:hypothetical protein
MTGGSFQVDRPDRAAGSEARRMVAVAMGDRQHIGQTPPVR